jgi:hypothetical protein
VIPKSEIVKQLNDMNMKIDKLFDLVYKIMDLYKSPEMRINYNIPENRTNEPDTNESTELEASFETL